MAAAPPSAVAAATRTERVAIVVAWGGAAMAVGLTLGALALLILIPPGGVRQMLMRSSLLDGVLAVALLAYAAVGALIAVRRPANRVGWTFLASGLGFALWMFTWRYAAAGLDVWPGRLPAAHIAGWLSLWLPVVGFGLAFTFLLQVFPDGALPSRRWRALTWFTAGALLVWAFTWATAPGPMSSFPDVDNPFGIAAVGRLDQGVGWLLFVLAVLLSAASLIVRFRRSTSAARRQIRWFAYAATLPAVALVVTSVASEGVTAAQTASEVLFPVAIVAVPAAAFIALFKHDLYDLDLVVTKTITFGALAALITGGYVALVAGIGAAVGAAGEQRLGLAVLATAAVAVVFQPARARIQRLANRAVYGPRATPYEVLAEFARRMGSTLEATEALPLMARTVGEGTGAARAEVWLVVGEELHRVASWPTELDRAVVPLVAGALPPLAQDAVEVRHQGALLGAIAVTMPPGRESTPIEQRLLGDVAAQAGLVLRNVRLVEEVKASRQRLVVAQDEERRRLERDIHDGVQQRLVTLSLALQVTADEARRDDRAGVVDAMDAAAREAKEALVELRRLARGIHPAVVNEGGLPAAIESLAERAMLPVELRIAEIGRLQPPIEITVYYLVAEALTNAAKHAEASTAGVDVQRAGGRLLVEVTDDGVGGAAPSPGSGLAGLADRVAAVDGSLEIVSPVGAGTRVRAELPCASR